MITLINTNTMTPPIGPIGLDYIATAARKAGIEVDVIDLCLTEKPIDTLSNYFRDNSPRLVGFSFRNVDDCFWPSAQWFVPDLAEIVSKVKTMTDAPIVLGGVGFSIFAQRIVEYTGADFGIHGDGEQAVAQLYNQLQQSRDFHLVEGLIWRNNGSIQKNQPAWPAPLSLPTGRDIIDNLKFLKKGGQCGLETKRGCNRKCIYCADPLAKGANLRLRAPSEVADEVQSLIKQQIDVLHLCDSEFNIPRSHALDVCREFINRGIAKKISWYTYMSVTPFDSELAEILSRAGCVGIDFTGDSASLQMLKTYRQPHVKNDLTSAVRLCRKSNIKVMIDLLLGGPGEIPETVKETIGFIKQINPDCAGAPLGVRIYPDTEMAYIVEGPLEMNPNIRRKYAGAVDFFKPTFYVSQALGREPAKLIKDTIAGDERFFEPMEDVSPEGEKNGTSTDHNYNDNTQLVEAIENGARGAYWDILHNLRSS
jgi:radical SAM superfamily enzyme YgiQ (UPF0313 family)